MCFPRCILPEQHGVLACKVAARQREVGEAAQAGEGEKTKKEAEKDEEESKAGLTKAA